MIRQFMMATKNFQQDGIQASQRGFTLIELLVVIAIIGILASVVLASLDTARSKARDAIRLSDMKQINYALDLFFLETGRYPGPTDGVPDTGQIIGVGNAIDTALQPYLDPVPQDPKHDAGNGATPAAGSIYFYAYDPVHLLNVRDGSDNPACHNNPGSVGYTYDWGITFGFNRAESSTNLRKDTCSGSNLNLHNADHNRALTPAGT